MKTYNNNNNNIKTNIPTNSTPTTNTNAYMKTNIPINTHTTPTTSIKTNIPKKPKLNTNNSESYLYIVYIILGLILVILIGVLIYYLFFYKINTSLPTSIPTPTPSITPTPIPTLSGHNINIIKTQLNNMGNNYNKLSDDKKERLKYCYQNPEKCPF